MTESSLGPFWEAQYHLSKALNDWVKINEKEFKNQDDAYEKLNDIFQPILDKNGVAR